MGALSKLLTAGIVTAGAVWLLRPRVLQNYVGRNVVITGGSRGLGLELARAWGTLGARIAICGRDATTIERAVESLRARGITTLGLPCDVRDQQQCRQFIDAVQSTLGPIDVLVNNAGVIQAGPIETMAQADFEDAMGTHFWGPLYLMDAVLPQMRQRRSGQIVNISSIGGRISIPHFAPYCASKFALVALSEGMGAELEKDGLSVVTVTPGLMRTGSQRNALFKGRYQAEFAWFSIGASLPALSIDSATAARRIVEACRSNTRCVFVSGPSSFLSRLNGLAPELGRLVAEQLNKLLPASESMTEARPGWQCTSSWSPSWLTSLGDQAAVRNHEVG